MTGNFGDFTIDFWCNLNSGKSYQHFSVKEQNVFAFKWWEGQQLLYVTSNYYGGYTNKAIQCNVELRTLII